MESIEDKLKAWLTECIKGIVSNPDAIEITATTDEMGLFFTVKVSESDRGKVIRKDGKHAMALRVLLRCAGGQNDVRASMKVVVPGMPEGRSRFDNEG